jgi:hypothetical protein
MLAAARSQIRVTLLLLLLLLLLLMYARAAAKAAAAAAISQGVSSLLLQIKSTEQVLGVDISAGIHCQQAV